MNVVGTVGLVSLSLSLSILTTKYLLARRCAATHREDETLHAPITVLQPILSGDPQLEQTLRSNLRQWGEEVRVLWLVDEDDVEGQRVTSTVNDPRVAVLLCPPPNADANPKSIKLQRALAQVDTPYVAILDDDTILASPDHLGRAMFALQSCTLYTGLPSYLAGGNLWSSLVAHFVNNNSILTYLPLLPLTAPLTINGMFYVMRTAELRAMGGFEPIVSKLCDDYALAALVKQHGGTIRQGITPQFLRTTVPDARRYIAIMQRWFLFANVLLRDQPFRLQLLLIPFLGLPPLFFALSFLSVLGGILSSLLLATALVLRHLILRSLHRALLGPTIDGHSDLRLQLAFNPLTSIVSELLQPLHWLHACVQHSLQWRTRRIELRRDGTFSYVGSYVGQD